MKKILFILLIMGSILPISAQTESKEKPKKAWEFGLGGTVYQFNRASFSNFVTLDDGGYQFDLKLKSTVYGGNIYVARELSKHFYLDMQGSVGYAGKTWGNNNKNWLYTAGLGLQWRLGEYFHSKYVDPYLRVGAGYMYKDFHIYYEGAEGLTPDQMTWVMDNLQNKDGVDRKHLIPITAGVGVNMWLNDRWGIGLQGDYVAMPYKNVANSLQGTVRVIYRLGGATKKTAPQIQYVDRPVERVVERIVEVEKIVEKPTQVTVLVGMFNNILFDFDLDVITPASEKVLDDIAQIMKEDTSRRFLISGFTDARGAEGYNQNLSERRAKQVKQALIDRGVPANMLKSRGAASRIAIASTSESHQVREGDRKVTVEIVTNKEYWDYLTKKGL